MEAAKCIDLRLAINWPTALIYSRPPPLRSPTEGGGPGVGDLRTALERQKELLPEIANMCNSGKFSTGGECNTINRLLAF